MVDLSNLEHEQFENICGLLLLSEGFRNVTKYGSPNFADKGVDLRAESPQGEDVVVQTVLFNKTASGPNMQRLKMKLIDLSRGRSLLNAKRALLIISTSVLAKLKVEIHKADVEIWDESVIQKLLAKHPSIETKVEQLVTAQTALSMLVTQPNRTIDHIGTKLLAELEKVLPGTAGWRNFEDACIAILNYVFVPPLRIPMIQKRSEDGLDRRDAIYPIGASSAFWESIKYDFSSRLVVAEFKNHEDAIRQSEVESLQQYLYPKAMRSFGLLCCRQQPSESAMKARRRAWMIGSAMILFITIEDLNELVKLRSSGADPSTLLDGQMTEFFAQLSP